MLTKLPLISATASQPLWINDPELESRYPNDSIFRSDYRGHFHKSRTIGQGRLTAKSTKYKNSAYLSEVNLAPLVGPGKIDSHVRSTHQPQLIKRYWARQGTLTTNKGYMDENSSYKNDYTEKEITIRPKPESRHKPLMSETPFTSESVYKSHYVSPRHDDNGPAAGSVIFYPQPLPGLLSWGENTPPLSSSAYPTYYEQGFNKLNKKPFANETSYKAQFPAYSGFMRERKIIPSTTMRTSVDPLESMTSYKHDFYEKPTEMDDRTSVRKRKNSYGYDGGITLPSLDERNPDSLPKDYDTRALMPYHERDQAFFYVAEARS